MATLSPTEAYLWDYIENHQQAVVNASITHRCSHHEEKGV